MALEIPTVGPDYLAERDGFRHWSKKDQVPQRELRRGVG